MLTVHAAGGGKMLRAAANAARSVNPALMVLGVTVLTSMDDQDLEKVGVGGRVVEQVLRLASLAIKNGCQGVVASALEAADLRAKLGNHFLLLPRACVPLEKITAIRAV